MSTKGLIKHTEQSDSEQIDNNIEIRIPAHKSKKAATITESAKLMGKEPITMSAKGVLEKNVQDVSVKKVWIQDID